eukprot:1142849-Pelagomonas_calceolata.AAC.3
MLEVKQGRQPTRKKQAGLASSMTLEHNFGCGVPNIKNAELASSAASEQDWMRCRHASLPHTTGKEQRRKLELLQPKKGCAHEEKGSLARKQAGLTCSKASSRGGGWLRSKAAPGKAVAVRCATAALVQIIISATTSIMGTLGLALTATGWPFSSVCMVAHFALNTCITFKQVVGCYSCHPFVPSLTTVLAVNDDHLIKTDIKSQRWLIELQTTIPAPSTAYTHLHRLSHQHHTHTLNETASQPHPHLAPHKPYALKCTCTCTHREAKLTGAQFQGTILYAYSMEACSETCKDIQHPGKGAAILGWQLISWGWRFAVHNVLHVIWLLPSRQPVRLKEMCCIPGEAAYLLTLALAC